MIDPRRSKFKKTTEKYARDSVIDIIDISEAIKKNKPILKSSKENFLYINDLEKNSLQQKLPPLDEYYFEMDNGYTKPFTDYYKPIALLGHGGFATVISAYDIHNKNNKVAVKIIPKYKFKNIADFLKREVSLHSELDHPNIVKLLYVRENLNYIFLVMELMEGGSLRDIIVKRYLAPGPVMFRDEECAKIVKNIFLGIKYLHSLKIIHRDVKPDNIMLKNPGDFDSIKLCDFGLSIGDETYEEKECGTPIFMPPELQRYNESADLWATGFIIYILCSGGEHPVFRSGMSYDEYLDKLKEESQDWKINQEIPILAKNLFYKVCKHQKHRRFTIMDCLAHPWITRNVCTSIPMTMMDRYSKYELINDFKAMLTSLLLLKNMKEKIVKKEEKEAKKETKQTKKEGKIFVKKDTKKYLSSMQIKSYDLSKYDSKSDSLKTSSPCSVNMETYSYSHTKREHKKDNSIDLNIPDYKGHDLRKRESSKLVAYGRNIICPSSFSKANNKSFLSTETKYGGFNVHK